MGQTLTVAIFCPVRDSTWKLAPTILESIIFVDIMYFLMLLRYSFLKAKWFRLGIYIFQNNQG